jgi:hypothetical protein
MGWKAEVWEAHLATSLLTSIYSANLLNIYFIWEAFPDTYLWS